MKVIERNYFALPGLIRDVRSERLLEKAAEVFGVTVGEILSRRRFRVLADARCACVHILRKTGMSHRDIATVLGGRDHSTSIHFVKLAKILLETDPEFARKVRHILNRL